MAIVPAKTCKTKSGITATLRTPSTKDAVNLIKFDMHAVATSAHIGVTSAEVTYPDEVRCQGLIESYLEEPGDLLLLIEAVIESETKIVAKLEFRSGRRMSDIHCGYFDMAVHAEWRGQGLGQILLEDLLNWGRTNPVLEVIKLDVAEENTPAVNLYRKLGFTEYGRDPYAAKIDNIFRPDLMMQIYLGPK